MLLRVAGRWSGRAPAQFALSAGPEHVFLALPPGASLADDGLWSAAFSLAAGLASNELSLLTDSGIPVALPAPAERPLEPPPAAPDAPAAAAPAAPAEQLGDALEDLTDANSLVEQLRSRCDIAEGALAELRAEVARAWAESGEVRGLLDTREAAHAGSKERARSLRARVTELEQRLEGRERTLSERRVELQAQCARLEAKLAERTESERTARAAADHAGELNASLQADAGAALAAFEDAKSETMTLRALLARARDRAEASEAELEASREQQAAAATAGERLEAAAAELAELRAELAEARAAAEQAAAAAAAATFELETERGLAMAELAEAQRRQAELEATAASAGGRADQAAAELDAERERANEADAALGAARLQVDELQRAAAARDERFQQTTRALSESEQALRTELDSLTRTDIGDDDGGLLRRRGKVSGRAHREALAELERAQAATAEQAERVTTLQQMTAALEAELEERTQVEADLRQLLDARQEELRGARSEAAEARARLAGLATEGPAAPAPAAAPDEPEPAAATPWTAADDELVQRIARAKELAGEDS